MDKKHVLSIIGPTAVGKTDLALQLTKSLILQEKFTGFDLISADSRQVYQGLQIISGADIPETIEATVKLHGLLMIKPNQEWSLAHFRDFGQKIIKKSWQENRLPIVVGGTGLYHHHLFSNDQIINIQPNLEVRQQAELLSIVELQEWLKKINSKHFSQMNHSDQHNPRRLVRAIEVTLAPAATSSDRILPGLEDFQNIVIGLSDSLPNIQAKIEQRVRHRFQLGAISEVEHLLTLDPPPTKPALSTAGVREIEQFLQGQATETEVITHWARREFQYAKRQLTWWKKYGTAQWFDCSRVKSCLASIEQVILST